MSKNVILKKGVLLPTIPDKFNSFDDVRIVLSQFRQAINSIILGGTNSGIMVGDNKVGIGMDNIEELENLVD